MDDFSTLCCIGGLVVLVAVFVLPRLLRGMSGMPQRGPINPTYDDPDIQGRGSFGAPTSGYGDTRPTYDAPNIQGRGSFGNRLGNLTRRRPTKSSGQSGRTSGGGSLGGGSTSGPSGRADSPNVQGRGSFGRDKKR